MLPSCAIGIIVTMSFLVKIGHERLFKLYTIVIIPKLGEQYTLNMEKRPSIAAGTEIPELSAN